jgi:hypothetical protein
MPRASPSDHDEKGGRQVVEAGVFWAAAMRQPLSSFDIT